MAFDVVNVGTLVNDGTGDTLRNGGIKINNNFAKAVEGPASATADGIPVFSGTSGKLLKSGTGAVITSTGNVGIGTTSIGEKLVVQGNVLLGNQNSTADGHVEIAGQGTGSVRITRTGAGATSSGMAFSTTFATLQERMRIDANGNVGIGTTSPGALFHSNGTIRYTNRPAAGTITTLGFDTNGDLKASSSSQRYKHNINTYDKGLNELLALRPVSFVYNGETRENIGFIAEEVDELGLPEVMLYDDAGQPEGVLYANMVALLTKAVQELSAQVVELRAEVLALQTNG
jgi:hypothetical protein